MQKFNFPERMMLLNSYKPKRMLGWLGFSLACFFLWEHQLIPALAALLISFIAGIAIAWKQDLHKLAETAIGKIMLVLAKPVNLIICTIGLIVFYYGAWLNNYVVIATGGIIMFASCQWYIRKAKRETSK